ncbi:MAG: flagellar basal body rod protein FlgB [candidate division Zixibacteria bacterium]|nr:flagellar basal body rod protein FlgB [candidate division Zixibacteria bacterium]
MSELIKNTVFNKIGIPLYRSYLNMASSRHKLIAGNLANISTPGYQSKDIDFHGELNKVVKDKGHLKGKLTHSAHLPVGRSHLKGPDIIVNKSINGNGVNNVDADAEIANLAQNQIYYSIGAKLLASKFQGLRSVIKSK